MRLHCLRKTIVAYVAVFLTLYAAGCNYVDVDSVHIDVPDSVTAWTPIELSASIPSTVIFGSGSSPDSWAIKNAGTTHARINGDILYTMGPGTVTLTATFKKADSWGKNVIKEFSIRIDPAPEEIHALGTELIAHGVNTADKPVSLKANINLAHWGNLLTMLIVADRYVNIDFTDSTGTEINSSGLAFNYNRYRDIYPKLVSVVLPDSITSIGHSAFSGCTSFASITIGNNVNSIGNLAFNGCSNLIGITLPNSVTSIGNSAFSSCSSLTDITLPDSVASIGYEAFRNCFDEYSTPRLKVVNNYDLPITKVDIKIISENDTYDYCAFGELNIKKGKSETFSLESYNNEPYNGLSFYSYSTEVIVYFGDMYSIKELSFRTGKITTATLNVNGILE